jgi:hypothetical protein
MIRFTNYSKLQKPLLSIDTTPYANNIGTKIDNSYCFYEKLLTNERFQNFDEIDTVNDNDVSFLPISMYPFLYNKYNNVFLNDYVKSKNKLKITFNQMDFRHDMHHSTLVDLNPMIDTEDNRNLIAQTPDLSKYLFNELIEKNKKIDFNKQIGKTKEWLKKQNSSSKNGYILIYTRSTNYLYKDISLQMDDLDNKTHFIEDMGYAGYYVPKENIISSKSLSKSRSFDCLITGQMHPHIYPFRYLASQNIKKNKDLKIVDFSNEYLGTIKKIEEMQRDMLSNGTSLVDFQTDSTILMRNHKKQFENMMRDSKVGIMCSSIFDYPLKKYFEYMANGCVVVGQMPKNKDDLGFKHLHNVCECSLEEIPDAIDFLMKNENIRLKIAKNARDLVLNSYTMDHAVSKTLGNFDRILANYM